MARQPTAARFSPPPENRDQRVMLHGVSWDDLEAILRIRGANAAGPRIAYLEGELELMSPSRGHEGTKKLIARLLEAYALERDLELNGYGAWTLEDRAAARAIEPDECYVIGGRSEPARPDLAIEVEWSHGGLDKLEIYRLLGVPEVWRWRQGEILPYALRGQIYELIPGSQVLPDLDLELLVRFLDEPDQTRAVRRYVEALREG